ncbi:MAG: phenylacetate--CoA ligase [Euryarchaeota archaeon]|nr:phenylacetate--CoA ligase [Euryarchaeota archaeon]
MYWDRKAETIQQEELEELQLRRLRAIVDYCYRNSRFYRSKLKEAGVHPGELRRLEDLARLPFTTKEDLRENYPFGMLAVPREEVVRIHASSGTTGKPTIVAYTKKDISTWAELMARVLTCAGVTKRDTIQLIYNYAFFTGGLGFHYGAERVGAAVIPSGVGNSERQLLTMRDLEVTAFSSTPSYALYLAEFARERGIDVGEFSLRTGIFGAEPWMRQRIEEAYGIKAYDNYGLSELCGPGVAVECDARQGLHVWSDHFLLEVIDPESGEVLGPGEKGELVFTTLTKEAMPLLRYRTRDISMLIDEPCECGRTHPRIARLMGRSDDMLIIRGVNVFPSQVEHVLLQFPEVAEHYQIVVDRRRSMDVLRVKVEVTERIFRGEPEELLRLKRELEEKLRSVLGIRAEVTFVEPGTIPRSRGKAQRVVDLRKG